MIFVTGGTGMLGAYLLFDLISKDLKVKALKRKNSNMKHIKKIFSFYSSNAETLFNKIEWIEGDILNYDILCNAMQGVKHVYHTAAMVSFNPADHKKMMQVNRDGTVNMLEAALKTNIEKFCHVSSIAALGSSKNNELLDEESNRESADKYTNYSETKFQSEMEVWRAVAEGLNTIIVNPSVILGAGDWTKGSASMISTVNNGLKFYTSGKTGFVDVRDVSKAMVKIMESSIVNERFVLSSENWSYRSVFDHIADALNKKRPNIFAGRFLSSLAWRADWIKSKIFKTNPLITKETARSAHNKSAYNSSKITEILDFKFTPLKETIEHFCSIFLKEKH